MLKRLVLGATMMLLLSTGAFAEIYLGASYVSTDAEFETAVEDFEPSDSGWKAFGGINFMKFVGLEITYRDLGTLSEDSGGSSLDADLVVYDAALRGILPLGKFFGLFGKAGYANISTEGSIGTSDFDESEWEIYYGAGLEINFGEHFGIRAEWEEFDVDTSLNSFSGGAFFRF